MCSDRGTSHCHTLAHRGPGVRLHGRTPRQEAGSSLRCTPGDTLSRVAEPPEDDWFPAADVRFSRRDVRASIEDEWFVEDDPRSRGGSFDPWRLADRRVLVPAGIFLVFLIALLAAAGAFESSPRIAPPTVVAPAVSSGPAATTTPLSVAAITPAAAAVPTTPLKPGDAGAQVKLLQEELTRLGYSVGRRPRRRWSRFRKPTVSLRTASPARRPSLRSRRSRPLHGLEQPLPS